MIILSLQQLVETNSIQVGHNLLEWIDYGLFFVKK